MSPQLLFECISEEIPPRMQNAAATRVKNYITDVFNKKNVKFASVETFVTARRLVLFVDSISTKEIKNTDNKIKGPSTNAPKDALEGFLRKNHKTEKDLFINQVKGKDFYFIDRNNSTFNVQKFLKISLEEMLKNFSWQKSMYWGERKEKWVRPIKSILCILDDEIIPVNFAEITASNVTYGHRFLTDDVSLIVEEPRHYFKLLEENKVILQSSKRRQFILDKINEFTESNNLRLEKNDYLLNELTGLIERPIVLFGKVNQEKSATLPKEVVLSIVHTQQKYLALSDGQKILYFVTVVNVESDRVIKGYERVLEARLSDAQFLISQDKKYNLDYYVDKLDSILFHASLGNIGEKVKRIKALSKYIVALVPGTSPTQVERAAHLSKADLATAIVQEFPELQGIMGGYYACNEHKEVVESIIGHYKPVHPEQECPTSPSVIVLSIADKLDSLTGLIAAGEKISGSYDPFGLRRASIGIIRVILENKLHIPIRLLIDKSVSLYPSSVFTSCLTTSELTRKQVAGVVFGFCIERFKVILKNKGIEQDIAESVLLRGDSVDLLVARDQAYILNNYLNTPAGMQVLSIYKRINSIVSKAEKTDSIAYSMSYSKELLSENEEIALSNYATVMYKNIAQLMKNSPFNVALDQLASFETFIAQFMSNVKINCNSDELRRNRLSLLAYVISIFHLVANFSQVKQCK